MNPATNQGQPPQHADGQQHQPWAKSVSRWIAGLVLIVTALGSLFTAIGKLDNAISDKVKGDITQILYSTGLIEFTQYELKDGPQKSLDAGNGGVQDFAVLAISDDYLYRGVEAKEDSGGCNRVIEPPLCVFQPEQHTTYCKSIAILQSCTPGNSHVTWHVVAEVVNRYDAVKPTTLGKIVFWIFVFTGLFLITTPTFLRMFRRQR